MECQVCFERFDATDRRPKVLPCGHTYCLMCLLQLRKRTCPVDNKVFSKFPEKLPDNYIILQESNNVAAGFWCRHCKKSATEDCVDEHPVCSLKKARAEEVAPLLEDLRQRRSILESLYESSDAAAAILDGFRRQLVEKRDSLDSISERLQKAQGADSAAGWEHAKQAAVHEGLYQGLAEGLAQLVADLADPAVKCNLTVQRGTGAVEAWRGEVRPANHAAARLLLFQLACSGELEHHDEVQIRAAPRWQERSNEIEAEMTVEEMMAKTVVGSRVARGKDWLERWTEDGTPPGPGTVIEKNTFWVKVKWDSGTTAPYCVLFIYPFRLLSAPLLRPIFGTHERKQYFLHVGNLCSNTDLKGMSKVLTDTSLQQVRFLAGLHCDVSPAWSQKVLEQVAPRLEGLQMVSPLPRHIDVVLAMPHLQALSITGVTGKQLQLVSQMASLRRLELHCKLDAPLPVLTFPAAAAGAGLRWLRCGVHPLVTALSLARAHADSLEELQLVAASVEPYGCPDLAHEIQGCGLKKLRKLVLLRQTGYETYCVHSLDSCVAQIQKLWNMFLDCNVDVFTFCSECNECFKNQNM